MRSLAAPEVCDLPSLVGEPRVSLDETVEEGLVHEPAPNERIGDLPGEQEWSNGAGGHQGEEAVDGGAGVVGGGPGADKLELTTSRSCGALIGSGILARQAELHSLEAVHEVGEAGAE